MTFSEVLNDIREQLTIDPHLKSHSYRRRGWYNDDFITGQVTCNRPIVTIGPPASICGEHYIPSQEDLFAKDWRRTGLFGDDHSDPEEKVSTPTPEDSLEREVYESALNQLKLRVDTGDIKELCEVVHLMWSLMDHNES